MSSASSDVTQLLSRVTDGESGAAEQLLPLVYNELRRLAQHQLSYEPPGHTLVATAIVHEAWLRLVDQHQSDWRNRAHFFAIASTTIRRVLVDHARSKHAAKRGGSANPMAVHDTIALTSHGADPIDLLALDEALETLSELDERQGRVVELRFFGGLSVEETAHVLECSPRTIKNDWRFARAWLRSRLE